MKKEEVPQDQSNLSKNNMKELCYAVDNDGQYTTALSSGWEPKTIALEHSMQDIKERVQWANEQVKNGLVSPIVYFMEVHKMDWVTLAGYVSMWTWRVKRHGKPNVFKKLTEKQLQRYADAFEITIDELKNFRGI
ncbi:hypothetical protein BWK59_00425 [Flavobacterium davisii]|uniref:Uncharacterized protein n=1 Tax=Flavobacterium davisii TaxID=2906077 RepID=A0A246GLM6_9FLAO|nr:hypothetical protein [Flavobacterium davisii]OWP85353.1 hypothetical protein BWK59_00425 [Flavobacterium davisii]